MTRILKLQAMEATGIDLMGFHLGDAASTCSLVGCGVCSSNSATGCTYFSNFVAI